MLKMFLTPPETILYMLQIIAQLVNQIEHEKYTYK